MTYGEKAVATYPSDDPDIERMRKLYAEIIDFCDNARAEAGNNEQRRLYSVAITEAQTAQMWVVKAISYKAYKEAET
jgi:hypothetical protein